MKENTFASTGEIRQFFVAFLTTVIIVTCYHFGCTVIDILQENNSIPKYSVVHCYHHDADEDEDESEEESADTTATCEDKISSIALNN